MATKGINQRAIEELKNTARAAKKFGVKVVNGFTGSSIWHLNYSFPPVSQAMIDDGFKLLAERFHPILDVFAECGVKFALEVHPTEIAFDIYTAQMALEALGHREEFGFNFDPSHLIGKGRSCGVHPSLSGSDLPRYTSRMPRPSSTVAQGSWPATSTLVTRVVVGTSEALVAAV